MKKDENLCSWIFFSWILMIDDICQRQTNHLQTFGRQCRKIICHWIFIKHQKQNWINVQNVCRMKGDCDCVRAVFVATEFIRTFIFELCQVYHKMRFKIFYFMLYADFGGPEHANLLNNRKLQKHQIHCNLLCFDFHKCPIFRPKCTPWLKPSTSLQPFFSFLCEIWLSFTRKLLTLNLSSARYLYQWEKAKDLVSVRGFLLVLNSRLVVNNAPTSY